MSNLAELIGDEETMGREAAEFARLCEEDQTASEDVNQMGGSDCLPPLPQSHIFLESRDN